MERFLKFIHLHKQKFISLFFYSFLFYFLFFLVPSPLFDVPLSTVVLDRNGELLGAKIATDGQWRFPAPDSLPSNFKIALVVFEDKRFYAHLGVDFAALLRAFYLNVKKQKIVSGASTITMQTVRLARKNKARTVWEKCVEMTWATFLECFYTKDDILNLYAANAPFGSNVVGLEAASWKYFGRQAHQLSWAEVATLAVLPNSPSLIHPNRNREALHKKRDILLQKLHEEGFIDQTTFLLAKAEPLPQKTLPLPAFAPHLVEKIEQERRDSDHKTAKINTTLQLAIQQQAQELVERHAERLAALGVENVGILVAATNSGEVLAYIGNAPCRDKDGGCMVNSIDAPRSTGSLLKPLLYGAMLHEGEILPEMLVPDVPSNFGGYAPKNFDLQFGGAVPAKTALSRSLNVPAVCMLNDYGVGRFAEMLKSLGITTLKRPAKHYGLSLMLGGAEVTLWDMAGVYASLSRTLNLPKEKNTFFPLHFYLGEKNIQKKPSPIRLGAIWHTFEAMEEVSRPDAEAGWRNFLSARRVAWKTGTSFGFRDAWAIGCTPDYVVAVWAGNADGEGRPLLTGLHVAAPLLFDVFSALENTDNQWFKKPTHDFEPLEICSKSGFLASEWCKKAQQTRLNDVLKGRLLVKSCPFHKLIHTDSTGKFRANADCYAVTDLKAQIIFKLPHSWEGYYKNKNPDYQTLPPLLEACKNALKEEINLLYPRPNTAIFIPTNLDGTKSSAVFKATHQNDQEIIYWHLDDVYVGKTKGKHHLALAPQAGKHTITLIDQNGSMIQRSFEIKEH